MSALLVITLVLAALFVTLGTAKVAAVPFMRAAAAHAGLSTTAYRAIGVAELAGAVGLIAGLSEPLIGRLAVTGLLGLLLGALLVHIRAHDPLPRWIPAISSAGLCIAYATLLAAGGGA